MGAPILWAPGILAFFLQENLHVHKIPCFREGGGILGFFGGPGSADLILLGNASWFTKCSFTIFVPLHPPPPPNQQNNGFPP